MTDCFVCKYPNDYDAESYKWFREEKMLCEVHEKVKPKVTEYVLKTGPKTFIPPIPKKEEKSFYEREPGEDG